MQQTVFATLAALFAAFAWAVGGGPAPAVAHLVFAVGILPLIFAAISHFVPVLTRSGEPEQFIRRLPALLQGIGLLVPAALAGCLPRALLSLAAFLDALAALILLAWIVRRARRALGKPHPGWRWYVAALVSLLLALAMILLIALWPAQHAFLRGIHLHVNVLAFVGLAAFGTLPVLVPTVMGKPDPLAASWLIRHLRPMLAGLLLLVLAAAWPGEDFGGAPVMGAFSAMGGLLLLGSLAHLLRQWQRQYGAAALLRDGAAASLLAAVLGYALLLGAGFLHGLALIPARPGIAAFAALFLLPLLTGALSQLLPVWRWPGPLTPQRTAWRVALAAGGAWRALLFMVAGLAFLGGWEGAGVALAGCGLILFLSGVLRGWAG